MLPIHNRLDFIHSYSLIREVSIEDEAVIENLPLPVDFSIQGYY